MSEQTDKKNIVDSKQSEQTILFSVSDSEYTVCRIELVSLQAAYACQ